ncbi:MAG: hypothetical protein GC154_16280 [bacterium]|nr:hypothetical protein [bacterium]
MTRSTQPHSSMKTILRSGGRMRDMWFSEEAVSALANLAGAAVFRERMGGARPVLAGLIGCTGTGKSTLFNSLAEQEISETSWKAHNTRGPILHAHTDFIERLRQAEAADGPLLFPRLERQTLPEGGPQNASGSRTTLEIAPAQSERFKNLALIDLPDINTTLARDEKLIAIELLAWLDAAIFLVDEETLYHRDYAAPAELARALGQHCFCVINNRGRDRIERSHHDIVSVQKLFGAERLYILPEIKQGPRFTQEDEFIAFREALLKTPHLAGGAALIRRAAPHAGRILRENRRRIKWLSRLEQNLQEKTQEAAQKKNPIPLRRVIHDDVIQVMEHLGLKRFAVSNIYHFLKKTAATGAVSHSFHVAFGGQRDKALSELLRFDVDKLQAEVESRVHDQLDQLHAVMKPLRDEEELAALAPELRRGAELNRDRIRSKCAEAANEIEQQCRVILESDQLQKTLRNEPLSAVLIVLAMGADLFAIPGFGSFILTPSVLKYIPVGRFENLKRRFQQSLHDIIRDELHYAVQTVREARGRLTLDESDPLENALADCAHAS